MRSLDELILRAAENIPGISVLVVFGSRARGTHRPDSRVVDREKLSSRLDALEGYLAELLEP